MTKKELVKYCLTYPTAIEDYPFEGETVIMRHGSNRKWFALIIEKDDRLMINLKCEPMEAEFLRNVYKDVIPAWHMNKTHWNTVYVNGDVPIEALYKMIEDSFNLTKTKRKTPKKK